jgi:FecR protein
MRKLALSLSLALIALTIFAFVDADEGLSEMTLKRLTGDVTVIKGGETREVSDESGIEPGDRISTGSEGRAELRLEGARGIELAPRSQIEVLSTSSIAGRGGSVLGSSDEGDAVTVEFGRVSASSDGGRFRVDLSTGSSRVGVYEGSAAVSAPGETAAPIDRFFQADVAGNERVLEPSPLQIDESDAWDQIHLNDVLSLDERITKLGDGLATQLGGARPSSGYFDELVSTPVDFIDGYLRDRRVSDVLIGFTIARNTDAPLQESFERSFEYRNEGGKWGLIARIMDAEERELVAQLGRTIIDTGILAADADDEGPAFGADSASREGSRGGTSGGPSPGTSTGGGSGSSGGTPAPGSGGGGGGEPEPPEQPPEEEGGCGLQNPIGCLEDPVGGILGEGGLLGDGGLLGGGD